MGKTFEISISVGVPDEGTPSVYRVRVNRQDSAGWVECAMSDQDRFEVFRALTSLMGALLE